MTIECALEQQSLQPTLHVRFRSKVSELPQRFASAFCALAEYIGELGETPCGPPYARYHDMTPEDVDVEAGFPVARSLPSRGEIIGGELPIANTATFVHVGPYTAIAAAYDRLLAWIRERGLEPAPAPMYEFYLNGPDTPEAELRTKVVVPVRPRQ